MTTNELRNRIEKNLGIKIDFRRDVYIRNNYGCSPVMDYNKAKEILAETVVILRRDILHVNINMLLNDMERYSLKATINKLLLDYNLNIKTKD